MFTHCTCYSASLLTPKVRSMISWGSARGQTWPLNADLVMTHWHSWHLMNKQRKSACGGPRLSKHMSLMYEDSKAPGV